MFQPSTSNDPSTEATSRILRGLTVSTKNDRNHDPKSQEEIKNRAELLQQLGTLVQKKNLEQKPQAEAGILKIKIEYCGEKRSFVMQKPVKFHQLEEHILRTYKKKMHIYYSQGKAEVLISINDQDTLDRAIKTIEKANKTSLNLLVSKHEGGIAPPMITEPDASGIFSTFQEVPNSETCSSCGGSRRSIAPSWAGMSTVSSGIFDEESTSRIRAPSNFRKGKKLGSGAFGRVHVAHDVDTGKDLALKIIDIAPNNHEASREAHNLERDVEFLAQLVHPRILQYYGVQTAPDSVLIFMEYMPGGSVKDLIRSMKTGRLSTPLSRKYTFQVLEGLSFLHKKHIVHRDIKPANILRDLDGNVKIADFGSGKTLQKVASQNGNFIGTVHYTAPEVLEGKSAYGRKADVWSVGITLVEMLIGNVPFHEMGPMEANYAIIFNEIPLNFHQDVDNHTIQLVLALLDRNPYTRLGANEILVKFYSDKH